MPSERGQTQNDTYCVIHSQKGKIIGPIIISETSRDTDGKREIGYKEKIWNSMEIFSILIVVKVIHCISLSKFIELYT